MSSKVTQKSASKQKKETEAEPAAVAHEPPKKVDPLGRGKVHVNGAKTKKKAQSRSSRAELIMPVSRVHRDMKNGRYAAHIGSGAPVYLAAVLEYLVSEAIELAGNAARDKNLKRITPRMLALALRNDDELSELVSKAFIAEGGVLPHIHETLLAKKPKPATTAGEEAAAADE
jgi:histone H2A